MPPDRVALISGLVVVLVATPLAGWAAARTGVVDRPGPLKVHDRSVPYLGGLAVLAGLAVPLAIDRPSLLLPLGLATLLGLADDIGNLPATLRLTCELAVGIAVAVVVPVRGPVGALVAVISVVALVNAVNLLDGLDGLASGVGAASAAGFGLALGAGGPRTLALALAGGLVGFLAWNRPPARIYLGDAGSYLVGTALAVLVTGAFGPGRSLALAAGAVLFVAVPVADTTVAIVRRRRARRPLLRGDRGHLYDQLVDRGRSPLSAAVACISAQVVFVAVGLGIHQLAPAVAVTIAVVLVVSVGGAVLWVFTSPASWVR